MAWAAGFVDAVGALVLLHVYTSHMTGNTASFASNLIRNHLTEAFHHAWPIIPFVAGLVYSATTTTVARRNGIHSSFSIALITELVLLGAFIAFGTHFGIDRDPEHASPLVFYAMVSLPTAAMGIQTVTVTRVAGLRVYTTYLTGSLSKFAEGVTQYAFWFYDRTRGRFRRRIGKVIAVTPRIKYMHHALLTAGLWTGFFAGACSGVAAESRYGLFALLLPMAMLAVATAVDIIRPVAAADQPIE
jgi:uncharacterized membrane protein YoaK (UPF0700 family)